MQGIAVGLLLALAPLTVAAAPTAEADGDAVEVLVEAPTSGEVVRNQLHQAKLRGHAVATGRRHRRHDVVLVLDVSGSTQEPSGADVDGDGELGFNPRMELVEPGQFPEGMKNTDPGDSILAAEVAAAHGLLANLDPREVRVGVVTFSGEMHPLTGRRARYDQQDAWLETPLTSDYEAVRRGLHAISIRGPYGGTNFAAGLRLAITELAGLTGARSRYDDQAHKIVLFLTDGTPTFPIGSGQTSDPGDIEAALAAARLAHKAGIRINTYAMGAAALTRPIAATEMARLTVGTFQPVRNPADIVSFLEAVSFANVDDVVFTNLTTREVSTDVHLSPDGRFEGFVPMREGRNHIRVTALRSDGLSGSTELDLVFEPAGLSGRELSLELDRIRQRNKELMLLLERERVQRFRDRQRKRVEVELEEEPAGTGQ